MSQQEYDWLNHKLLFDRVEVMTKRSGWTRRSVYRCTICEKRWSRIRPRKECGGLEAGRKRRKAHGEKLLRQIDKVVESARNRKAKWATIVAEAERINAERAKAE